MTRSLTSELRLDMGDGDDWGTTMSHAFAVCHVLEHRRFTNPLNAKLADAALARLKYRDAPGCDGPEDDYPELIYRRWGTKRLARLALILNRYAARLEWAGEGY